MSAHVTTETRTVFRSARGWRLTKHAAYVGAAKHLIAQACSRNDAKRWDQWMARCDDSGHFDSETPKACAKDSGYQCRFHKFTQTVYGSPDYDDGHVEVLEPGGMLYYRRVLGRLVRFLKFVDGRRQEAA
jgi:hypothetical protein